MKKWNNIVVVISTCALFMLLSSCLRCSFVQEIVSSSQQGKSELVEMAKAVLARDTSQYRDGLKAQDQANYKHKPLGNGPFTAEEIDSLENSFKDQTHPRLLEWIRIRWVHKPSGKHLNLTHPSGKNMNDHTKAVDSILNQKKGGFYVECGAHDGETWSNTLFFERSRGWQGLLIEADPERFQKLLTRHRNAYAINACINSKNMSGKFELGLYGTGSGTALVDERLRTIKNFTKIVLVQCFTFYSIVEAIGRRKIDFFTLDIEGAEEGVVRTIPFSKLNIDLILIETLYWQGTQKERHDRSASIDKIMKSQGYNVVQRFKMDTLYRRIHI